VERQQLMRVAFRELVRQLRRDREQRFLIQIRAAERQHQVRCARAERRQHHAGLSAKLSVDRRGDAGIRLVPHQDEIDAGAPKLVDQHEHFASRQSEDAFDASVGDDLCGGCGGRQHASYARLKPSRSMRVSR
jgi:hypothetical protein